MQDFPCSRIGEIYKNPEYNIAYLGHIGIEFGGGLVMAQHIPLSNNRQPDIYKDNIVIGKVKHTNYLKRNNHIYAYTSAFDFEDNDDLVPILFLKSVQCITCERILTSLDQPCNCIFEAPILILQDYQLVGCELRSELNYTSISTNKDNILIDFFKDEYSFLEIHGDYSFSDGDKWIQRISLDIDI